MTLLDQNNASQDLCANSWCVFQCVLNGAFLHAVSCPLEIRNPSTPSTIAAWQEVVDELRAEIASARSTIQAYKLRTAGNAAKI